MTLKEKVKLYTTKTAIKGVLKIIQWMPDESRRRRGMDKIA